MYHIGSSPAGRTTVCPARQWQCWTSCRRCAISRRRWWAHWAIPGLAIRAVRQLWCTVALALDAPVSKAGNKLYICILYITYVIRTISNLILLFNRHIHYAGHLHIASGGCGHGGYTWHSGEDTFAARILYTNARSVCVLPSGADRVRIFTGHVADRWSGGIRWAGTGLRVSLRCAWRECRHEGKKDREWEPGEWSTDTHRNHRRNTNCIQII